MSPRKESCERPGRDAISAHPEQASGQTYAVRRPVSLEESLHAPLPRCFLMIAPSCSRSSARARLETFSITSLTVYNTRHAAVAAVPRVVAVMSRGSGRSSQRQRRKLILRWMAVGRVGSHLLVVSLSRVQRSGKRNGRRLRVTQRFISRRRCAFVWLPRLAGHGSLVSDCCAGTSKHY